MPKRAPPILTELDKPEHVFVKAAELFRVMAAPMRLKIISCLCDGEQNVNYLLSKINTTQPNMSQHLNTLYRSGVLDKRRDGVQIYYRIANAQIVAVCKAVCQQVQDEEPVWVSP
jgi:ArsR family transcriptional regulator